MKSININDFCAYRSLSNLAWAPDGSCACFTVTQAQEKENRYLSRIYMLKDGKVKQMTDIGKEAGFVFLSPNELLFAGQRDESKKDVPGTAYYRLPLDGGEAVEAFRLPVDVSRIIPLEDGRFILTATTVPGYEELYKGDEKLAAAYKKHTEEEKDYEVVEQVPWWWNGATYTKGAYDSLFICDADGKHLTRLSALNEGIYDVKADKKRGYVWYMKSVVRPYNKMAGQGKLCRMSLEDRREELVLECREGFEIESFLPGDSFGIVSANDGKYGLNTDGDFYKLDYETLALTPYAKRGEAVGCSVGSDVRHGGGKAAVMDGDTLYYISTLFDGAYICKLEDGVISTVFDKEGSADFFDVKDGKLLIGGLYGMRPQELYDGSGKRLTSFNSAAIRGKYIAVPEKLNTVSDGREIHGFILHPFGEEPGKKYPVILDIHGGPKTVYGPVFYHEMQYWAGKGYYVIYCNPVGSDGRGAFMDIRGKYGHEDFDDIMAFTDAALEAYPQMDKDLVYETGGSYGGFMTNWIIGHTDRFKACASQRSISNWFSFWGVSDIGPEFAEDQNASSPWNDPEKLWDHSPMKYADRVKTPTLFIHSFEDYRCPIDQGYQMFTSLITHGVEARLVCFRGENHELSRSGKPQHRIRRLKEITDWFDKHR